jgi:thiol-disulfide isomerase/thioredoxin
MRQLVGRLVLYAAILLAVGAGAHEAVREERMSTPLAPGTQAPFLMANKRGGGGFDLLELRGEVVLVSFWASWCAPCQREMPMLLELEAEYRARGLKLVTANVDELADREASTTRFLAKLKGEPPIVLWPKETTVSAWKAWRLPTLYIVGRDGRIVAGHTSLQSRKTLAREIEAALAQKIE